MDRRDAGPTDRRDAVRTDRRDAGPTTTTTRPDPRLAGPIITRPDPACPTRQIEEELARREFVPVIRRILRVSAAVEPSEWDVETDRGPTSFVLDSEDDVHELDEYRALVTDAHGIRYLIPDVRRLDAHSRHLLERFL